MSLIGNHFAFNPRSHPLPCHPDRSEAERRDVRFRGPLVEMIAKNCPWNLQTGGATFCHNLRIPPCSCEMSRLVSSKVFIGADTQVKPFSYPVDGKQAKIYRVAKTPPRT